MLINSFVDILAPNVIVLGGGPLVSDQELICVLISKPPCLLYHMRNSDKTAVYEPGSSPTSDTESACALILIFLDFTMVRNKLLFL
jgi:hypothetical protein